MMQESNSFASSGATLDEFAMESGDLLIETYRGTNTEVGGFLSGLEDFKAAVAIPLISAFALANGPIGDKSFDLLANLLVEHILKADVDGLLIALHGAWLSESHASADAELMKRVRSTLDHDVPVVATLDFHANVRLSLLQETDAVIGYRTYPHIDMAQTGRKAAHMIQEMLIHDFRPRIYWMSVPLLAPPQSATTELPPVKDVMALLDQEFVAGATLAASFFCVQPWLDVKEVASSLVVVSRSSDEQIPLRIQGIAQKLWRRRGEFVVDWSAPGDLVRRVLQERHRPVIVSEAFDGTTGGAPGDNPGLLSTLIPHRQELSACLYVVDPEAAREARELGVGSIYRGPLCARKDSRFGFPVPVEGRVAHLSDGAFVLKGPVFTGKRMGMGPTAVLEVGRLKVVVASRAVMTIDPELYRSQEVEPQQQDLVAIKSPTLFMPGYASMLGCILHLDMPGVCRGNLGKVPFSNIARPIHPLDDFTWDATSQCVFHTQ
jgi:microcystin degradation protein MlrC